MSERFGFGANWLSFVEQDFDRGRRLEARRRLLNFLEVGDLAGQRFLDIGSGSGLHSLAAFDAGAKDIHSFDYDELSVAATRKLAEVAGAPATWRIEQGDVLDAAYVKSLGTWDIVYSWGVLHHTGDMWRAVTNAASCVRPGGRFFIALYSSDVVSPSAEFWLDVKQRYNRAGDAERRRMERWYIWRFGIGGNPARIPGLVRQVLGRRRERGMSYMTDVRDWLGGWPMQFAGDQETVDFLEQEHGFQLRKIVRGEANTEFLFENVGTAGKKTMLSSVRAA